MANILPSNKWQYSPKGKPVGKEILEGQTHGRNKMAHGLLVRQRPESDLEMCVSWLINCEINYSEKHTSPEFMLTGTID